MDATLKVCEPTDAVRGAILAPLMDFNAHNGFPPDPQSLAIALSDSSDAIVGGLWGKTVYDWLTVEYLLVPETLRGGGFGTRLMAEAERIALDRGCVGAWLTTFPFQAQAFYEKLGYQVFATLDRSPRDNVRIFMRKHLAA
jgi:GNAT superfamily N-acetyltransferase